MKLKLILFSTFYGILFNAKSQNLIKVPVKANQLLYDNVHNLLYATVSSQDSIYGNSIVAINPYTGQVVKNMFIGSEPKAITLTSDCNHIFVGLDAATIVKKVNALTFSIEDVINLGSDSFFGGYFPYDLATISNRNDIVIVSRHWSSTSPANAGIVMYKGQQKLALATTYTNYGFDIEYNPKNGYLYSYDSQTSGSDLSTLTIDTVQGISQVNSISIPMGNQLKYANRYLFGSSHNVADLSGATPYQVGTFSYNASVWGSACAVNDSATTYYISETINNYNLQVVTFNVSTFLQSGAVTYSNVVPNNNYEVVGMTAIGDANYAIIVKDTYNASFGNAFGWYVLLKPFTLTGITQKSGTFDVNVFPNPVKDHLRLRLPDGIDKAKLQLVNLQGETVLITDYQTGGTGISLARYASGMYLARIETQQGIEMIKLIKE